MNEDRDRETHAMRALRSHCGSKPRRGVSFCWLYLFILAAIATYYTFKAA